MTSVFVSSTARRRRRHGRLVGAGLVLAGLGFVLAGVQPGAGPRLVTDGSEVAGLYLPPVIAGAVILLVAAVVLAGAMSFAVVLGGGVVAVVLLVGSVTVGLDGIVYRLGDPVSVVPFVADAAQLVGEIVAIVGGVRLALSKRRLASG